MRNVMNTAARGLTIATLAVICAGQPSWAGPPPPPAFDDGQVSPPLSDIAPPTDDDLSGTLSPDSVPATGSTSATETDNDAGRMSPLMSDLLSVRLGQIAEPE